MLKTAIGLIVVATLVALCAGIDVVSGRAGYGVRAYELAAPKGTVAHWRFAGPPGCVAGEEMVIRDVTGEMKAIVFGGPVLRTVDGRPGLEFNGGDERVSINDDPVLALTRSMTLEAIIRFDGTVPDCVAHQIVFRGDDRVAMDPWCLYVTIDGRLLFHVDDGVGHQVELLSPGPLPVGKIMSVAGTLDDRTGEMRLYVDRRLVCSAITSVRPMAKLDQGSMPGVGIGNVQSANYKEAFNGLISEVRISDCAIEPRDMLSVQAKPRPAPARMERERPARGSDGVGWFR